MRIAGGPPQRAEYPGRNKKDRKVEEEKGENKIEKISYGIKNKKGDKKIYTGKGRKITKP
jgi:hypothetical protein